MVIINCKCQLCHLIPMQIEINIAEGACLILSLSMNAKNYSAGYLAEGTSLFATEAKILMDKNNIKAVLFKDYYSSKKNKPHWYIYVPEINETTTWTAEPTAENITRFIEGFKCLYR